eukprot:gene6528-7270_t
MAFRCLIAPTRPLLTGYLRRAGFSSTGKVLAPKDISSHKQNVNGIDLHYEVAGESSDVILCLPGALGSSRSDFGPQLRDLSDKFTVIAFDPRGYGKSIPPWRDFPENFFQRDADDAAELMLKIGCPKFSVLGWSDGGMAGIILAAMRPELVKKLVVWGSNSYISDEDIELVSKVRDLSKWSERMRAPLEATYGKDKLQGLWSNWMDAFFSFKQRSEDGDICKTYLSQINTPTLVVHGAKDSMVAAFHPVYIHENIKGSKLHYFEEGKHNLHLRFHEEFNKLVTDFILEN